MIDRGFGVAGALDRSVLQAIAPEAERHRYRTFWVNDTLQGDGLAALAEVAAVTKHIRLGVGVIALDRQPANVIAQRIKELKIPVHRLTLGIGSGGTRQGALTMVEDSAKALIDETGATVVVAALGPKMCALAGAVSNGALLNWLTPEHAAASADMVRSAAIAADRPEPRVDAYVRVALGEAARPKLESEARRYARVPSYSAHFDRMDGDPLATTVASESASGVQAGLAPFDEVLDETIVRAITANDDTDSYLALIEAGAPPRDLES